MIHIYIMALTNYTINICLHHKLMSSLKRGSSFISTYLVIRTYVPKMFIEDMLVSKILVYLDPNLTAITIFIVLYLQLTKYFHIHKPV